MRCHAMPNASATQRRPTDQLACLALLPAAACRQVVLLRPGLATWSHSLAQPGVKVRSLFKSWGALGLNWAAMHHWAAAQGANRLLLTTRLPATHRPSCLQFYEVDSRPAVQRKKQLLDELLPGWRHAAQRPRFVEGARAEG